MSLWLAPSLSDGSLGARAGKQAGIDRPRPGNMGSWLPFISLGTLLAVRHEAEYPSLGAMWRPDNKLESQIVKEDKRLVSLCKLPVVPAWQPTVLGK